MNDERQSATRPMIFRFVSYPLGVLVRWWRMPERIANGNSGAFDPSTDHHLAWVSERIAGQERVMIARFDAVHVLIAAQAERTALVQAASDKAILKAETAVEKRFDAVNGFREQMSDQSRRFASREAVDAHFTAMETQQSAVWDATRARLETLERSAAASQGRGLGLTQGWGYLVGVISLVVLITNFVFFLAQR